MSQETAHVLVDAHAAGDRLAAPNSWAALTASHAAGPDLIEIDARCSSDGLRPTSSGYPPGVRAPVAANASHRARAHARNSTG